MSIIQDKLGNEFLRNGGMEPNFPPGMIMFSHLPPVTSFARIAAGSVMHDLPQEMVLKKERNSPIEKTSMDFIQTMGIKQEKMTEHDYRVPLYGSSVKNPDLLEVSLRNPNLLIQDLSIGRELPGRTGKETKESAGKKTKRSSSDSQDSKPRRKRGESSKSGMLDGDAGSLSPNSKPHICEHCNAAFRSSYHLRRHVLIHTGERPFRCSQCNMSFIQKYLLQRHEKIHSGEKPFSCDQCNMRFIQKYHMERHKRTHSGEKPYKCDTCQQYFSRTDRLLKHKRTCGEAIKKGMEPGTSDQGSGDIGHSSYSLTQGNISASGRKKGKSKNASGEAGERKKKKLSETQIPSNLGLHDYAVEIPIVSSSNSLVGGNVHSLHSRAPKLVFKKVSRKSVEKNELALGAAAGMVGQKLLSEKSGSLDLAGSTGVDGMGLLQGSSSKPGQTSSNYDDAMQFLKKRRYLQAANSGDYGVNVGHMASQQTVIQGAITSVMESEATLNLLDSSPMNVDMKPCHDKSGIPDEVLQSLLDHYSQKSDGQHDVTFDISDQHVDIHPSGDNPEMGQEENVCSDSPSSTADKSLIMHEYSKFLLQALERTSHSSTFTLGSGSPFVSLSSSSHPNTLFSDKHVYTTPPLESGFGQSVTSVLPAALPKSHFGMLVGSSQPSFHLSSLDSAHQQLTPSQELTDQIEQQKSLEPPAGYPMAAQELGGQKEQGKSTSSSYQISSQELAVQLDPGKNIDLRATYQIENFAQAFGSQFKSGSRVPLAFSGSTAAEVDHRIRTPVSEFSGYTNLLSDVNEPVSTGSKTPTSQSYR
ncbi:zinc finger protein 281-like isoform X2 [Polypterus senegalus]